MNKKKALLLGGIVAAIAVIAIIVIVVVSQSKGKVKTDVVYKEVEAAYGALAVGVSEDTTVSIGTVTDTFDVDITALVRTTSSSSSSNSGPGGDMFGGGFGGDMFSGMGQIGGTSTTKSDGSTTLTIEKVIATVGSRVEAGDPIYQLSEESIAAIRETLEKDVKDATQDLKDLKTTQETTMVSAKNTYAETIAYGENAQNEYDKTIQSLNDNISDIQKSIADAQASISANNTELTELKEQYKYTKAFLDKMEETLNNMSKFEAFYTWMQYDDTRDNAKSTVEKLESQIEQLESSNENLNNQIEQYNRKLTQAQMKLETGTLSAKKTYELRLLAYDNAKEAYDISVTNASDNVAAAEKTLQKAQEKLAEFDSQISGEYVYAKSSGLITSIPLAAGDTLTTNTELYTLYDDTQITVSANVYEDDLTNISIGSQVNLVLVAYPDDSYAGVVSEISDASYDSSGNIYYSVTATITGDVENLYEGMTGTLTFITKEVKDVIYVSNRSIFQDGTREYVKILDENGNITEKDVTTGFSDGVSVEITGGIEAGEKILIESKVTASET